MIKIYQQMGLIAKTFVLAICAACCFATTPQKEFDDWIDCNTCSQHTNILCQGYYKPLPLPEATTQSSGQPIKVTADSASFVAKGTSIFTGNVVATQGDKAIYADKADVVHDANGDLVSITAYGQVKIMQPGMRVDGSSAVAYVGSEREEINNAVYRIYDKHARGVASKVVVLQNHTLILKDSTYTTCAPDSNAWYLKASTTELNKTTGRGEAWNARLYAKDVPVFYFPYVNFPIDKRRQSGFLQPEYENSSLNGQTIIAPYYLNLAPNYDATITSNYMSLRGFKFDTVFRYLTRTSSGEVDFDFLPQDHAYRALRSAQYGMPGFATSTDPEVVVRRNDLKSSNFRYRVAAKNNSYLNPCWLFSFDFTTASDGNYLYDFQPESSSYVTDKTSSLYALQRAALQNFSRIGTLRAQVEHYEVFHVINGPSGTEQLSKLPAIDFNSILYTTPVGISLYALASYINFRPDVITGSGYALTYGQRFHIRPAVGYPIVRPGWFFLPRVQVNYVQYDRLTVSPFDRAQGVNSNNPRLTLPMYDLKTGMIFERDTRLFKMDLLQTLEPTLYYLYVPRKNQSTLPNLDSGVLTFDYNQVFRDNRYTGGDYVSDANQLGMGIATKFYNADTGEEQGMLGVGKIKYFRNTILFVDRQFANTQQHWSPWAVVGKLRITPNYDIEANLVSTNHSIEIASMQLQYHPSPWNVMNVSYEYLINPQPDDVTKRLNSNLNQVSISSAWQISTPWRLLGKLKYDLRFHRFLESLAGFEYHTCCTAIRFMWCRTSLIEISSLHGHDNRFRLQFIFKGLGGIGNAADSYIASVIPGYKSLN